MKKIIGILILFLFVFSILPININANSYHNPLNGGWLEYQDGVTILHVSGTNYEMGYQHGNLLNEKVRDNVRIVRNFLESIGWSYEDVLEVWNIQEKFVPQKYKEELQGLADGCGLTYEEISVHNTLVGIYNHIASCWGTAAWGDSTIDGNLLHFRSCDGVEAVRDPDTGEYYQSNQVLIVRDPDYGYASIYPIFIGNIISVEGFNERGIGVSELTIVCTDTTFYGLSAGFRMRMVLDYASDANEAINIMNTNRTCGWNFIVSDGNIPTGYIIEQSANMVYVGTWFDPVEATDPFWQIKDVVRRGNCYINPFLVTIEREQYDPSGINGFINCMLGNNRCYYTWTQYKAISNEIQKYYGNLDINSSMTLLREVYNGRTNIMFRLLLTKHIGTGRQWIGCPATGDIVISFAENEIDAFLNPVHHFNLFELLESEPP